ncbi:MAG: S-layer homology domain-containing protein [Candidatus Ornithomonoglobus sp.]
MKKALFFATALAVASSSFSAFAAAPLYSFWDKPEEFAAEELNRFNVPITDEVKVTLNMLAGWSGSTPSSAALSKSTTAKKASFDSAATLDMTNVAKEWTAYLDAAVALLGEEATEEQKEARRALAISSTKLSGDFTVEITVTDKDTGSISNDKLAAKDDTGWTWDDKTLELFEQKSVDYTVDEAAKTKTFTLVMSLKENVNEALDEYFTALNEGSGQKLTLTINDNEISSPATTTTYDTTALQVDGHFSGDVTIDPFGAGTDKSVVKFDTTDKETVRIYYSRSGGGGGGGTTGSTSTTPPTVTANPNATEDPNATENPNATEDPNATTAPEATRVPGGEASRPTPVPNPKTGGTANGAKLNYDDHYAYIIGYPAEPGQTDDYREVRPQNNITRAEVATIFFRMLTDDSRAKFWTQDNSYSDVVITDWYNNAISTVSNAGIVNGYDDGTFGPDRPITRAEFAAIAARFDTDPYTGGTQFSDISGHWAEEAINKAAAAGWINGYEDGTFRPNQYIVRSEAMTLINRLLYRLVDEDGLNTADMVKWIDNNPGTWYYANVQEATNSHHFDRVAIGAYETWTTMRDPRDWEALEKSYSQVTDAGSEESVYFDEEARDNTSSANAEATEETAAEEEAATVETEVTKTSEDAETAE